MVKLSRRLFDNDERAYFGRLADSVKTMDV